MFSRVLKGGNRPACFALDGPLYTCCFFGRVPPNPPPFLPFKTLYLNPLGEHGETGVGGILEGRGNSFKNVKRLQKGAGGERGEMGVGGGRGTRLQPRNWFFKTPRVAHGRLGREVGGAGERGLLPPHPPYLLSPTFRLVMKGKVLSFVRPFGPSNTLAKVSRYVCVDSNVHVANACYIWLRINHTPTKAVVDIFDFSAHRKPSQPYQIPCSHINQGKSIVGRSFEDEAGQYCSTCWFAWCREPQPRLWQHTAQHDWSGMTSGSRPLF